MNSKQIAADLAINLPTMPQMDTLIAAEIAFSYRVNSNVASAALRRLVSSGVLAKDRRSYAGNLIYRVVRTGTVVTPPPASPVLLRETASA